MSKRFEMISMSPGDYDEDKAKRVYKKYCEILSRTITLSSLTLTNKVKLISTEFWGNKRLAYPMKGYTTGWYHQFEFEATPEDVEKLEAWMNTDKDIMKHIVVVKDITAEYDTDTDTDSEELANPTNSEQKTEGNPCGNNKPIIDVFDLIFGTD